MSIIENIRTRLNDNEFAIGVFVDMKKVFDTVDHEIPIRRLEHYGVRDAAKDWFCLYLANRKQFVSLNNHNSTIQKILARVPQGSVLGTLLFLIYINNLHNRIKYSRTYHFEDDTNFVCSDKSLYTLANKVNHALKNLSQWLKANKLSLNVKKTELIIFRQKEKPLDHRVKFKLNGKRLFPTSSVKFNLEYFLMNISIGTSNKLVSLQN